VNEHQNVQKSVTVPYHNPFEMPKSLDDIPRGEVERRQCISRVMTHTLKYLSSEFTANGFEWLLPVVFSQSTDPLWPDHDASIEKRLEVEIYGKTVRPTASMIIHKLVACSIAHPRLFILSPNVRIEKRERQSTGIHAYEFTQLDFEMRDASSVGVRRFVEKVTRGLIASLKRNMMEELKCLRSDRCSTVSTLPFKVYDRTELEEKYGLDWASQLVFEADGPVWVTNIPREFYDFEDFDTGKWDNYDLFLPQYGEVLSGARREVEYSKIVAKIEKGGVRKENYNVLLRLAREGRLKPSAGGGIGLERLVGWIVEAKHIGEVQPFPRIPGRIYEL
jgi:asparaginyl-tRNA synthetase